MRWYRGRGRPPHPDVLTPAEWRVLALLREGRSNAEIGDRLGLSVNTVRYHVSNMLAKVGVADRAELAAWQGEPIEVAAAGRPLAFPFIGWWAHSWVGRATLVGGIAAIGVIAISALESGSGRGGGEEPAGANEVTATATSPPTAEPSAEPAAEVQLMPFSGVLAEIPPHAPASRQVTVGDPPPSPFAPRDAAPASDASFDVVLYDVEALAERNLGPGSAVQFNPDATRMAWLAFETDPRIMTDVRTLMVLDLETDEVREIGRADSYHWLDSDRLILAHVTAGTGVAIVDAATGAYSDSGGQSVSPPPPFEWATGLVLEDVSPEPTGDPPWWRRYRLTYLDGSRAPVEFDAYRAALAPDGVVAFALPPTGAAIPEEPRPGTSSHWGTTIEGAIYLGDTRSLDAEYVTTALLSYGNWPLDVSEQQVFWTDDACSLDGSERSRFFDRATGDLVEIDRGLWGEFTPTGALGVGAFGAGYLFDTESFQYELTLTDDYFAHVTWSADYRYAAIGYTGGHGGLCP